MVLYIWGLHVNHSGMSISKVVTGASDRLKCSLVGRSSMYVGMTKWEDFKLSCVTCSDSHFVPFSGAGLRTCGAGDLP